MKFLIVALSAIASVSALRGGKVDDTAHFRSIDPPDTACFKKANTVDVCEEVPSSDGMGNCVWCQTKDDSGICVSRNNAKDLVKVMGVPCPKLGFKLLIDTPPQNTIATVEDLQYEDLQYMVNQITGGIPDVNCFKAAWFADNAETACMSSKDANGSNCVWCTTAGDVAGVCLSKPESSMANSRFGLTCANSEERWELESFENFMEMQ